LESLGEAGGEVGEGGLERRLALAIHYYLVERGTDRAEWRYSVFGRDRRRKGRKEVRFVVEEEVWRQFADEAQRQGVSTDELLQHAALYFAADRDAGRIAERIIEDLGRIETEP